MLMEIPPSEAVEAAKADVVAGAEAEASVADGCVAPPAVKTFCGPVSERSAKTTPNSNNKQRLVAKPPTTPGLASKKRRKLTSHGA